MQFAEPHIVGKALVSSRNPTATTATHDGATNKNRPNPQGFGLSGISREITLWAKGDLNPHVPKDTGT